MVIQISQFLSNKKRCTRAKMYLLCSQITRCCACVCSQKSEGLREREREKANVRTVDSTYMLACWTILTLCKPCMGILAFFSCIFSVNTNFFPCKSSIYRHLKLKWKKEELQCQNCMYCSCKESSVSNVQFEWFIVTYNFSSWRSVALTCTHLHLHRNTNS